MPAKKAPTEEVTAPTPVESVEVEVKIKKKGSQANFKMNKKLSHAQKLARNKAKKRNSKK